MIFGKGNRKPDNTCTTYACFPITVNSGVELTPNLSIGEVKTHMGRKRVVCKKDRKLPTNKCQYTIFQMVCVEIPIEVDMQVEINEDCD